MNNIITSLDVKQNSDGTAYVKYSISFEGTNHVCYGDFNATEEESSTAFKGATTADMWNGFKKLILTRLNTESANALNEDTKTQ